MTSQLNFKKHDDLKFFLEIMILKLLNFDIR
jgi:hypothetical protein